MKSFLKFLFRIHKYVGGFIAVFFLMWFVTGVILVYHPYPRISDKMVNSKMETLDSSLPDLNSVANRVDGEIQALSLKQFQGQTVFKIKTGD